jgi:hypothetical protein
MTPEQEKIYEDGFIAGMQKQMQSSVDKAVNAMARREWVGLTDEEMQAVVDAQLLVSNINVYFKAIEAKLKEKNT